MIRSLRLTITTQQSLCNTINYSIKFSTMPRPPCVHQLPLPIDVQVITQPLSNELINQLQQSHSITHKQVHYGNRLLNEDNQFGLPIPPSIPNYLQSIVDTYTGTAVPCVINRVSVRTIHPGAHTKPVLESNLYESFLILIPVGSHIAIKLQPIEPSSTTQHTHDIIIPDSCALILLNDAVQQYSWNVIGKTRDWIDNKQVKRKETIFIELRHVQSIGQQQSLQSHAATTTSTLSKDKKILALPVSDISTLNAAIESAHVQNVYDSIAGHFSSTRHTPWPKIDHYVRCIPSHSIVADVGCGNGKYMGLNKEVTIIGCDLSEPLVKICDERGYHAVVGDALNIPLRSNMFDFVLNIAVLHHISTVERRIQIINELLRVCKSGGEILVSAWAFEQDSTSRRSFPTQDVYVPWNVPARHYKPDAIQNNNNNSTNIDHNDSLVSTPCSNELSELLKPKLLDTANTEKLIVVHRYCHVYKQGELQQLFESAELCTVVNTYYDRGNWCVLVRKH